MTDIAIQSDRGYYELESRRNDFNHTSIVSLDYRDLIMIRTRDERILNVFALSENIRIQAGERGSRKYITTGVVTRLTVRYDDTEFILNVEIEDESINTMKRSFFSGVLNGELTSELNRISSVVVVKGYTSPINLFRYVEGFQYDILNDISKEFDLAFNFSNGKVYIGDLLSRKSFNIPLSAVKLTSSSFRSRLNENIRKHDITMNYKPELRAGDTLNLGKHEYIIAMVEHKYETSGNLPSASTFVSGFQNNDDLLKFIDTLDPQHEIKDLIDLKTPDVRYDIENESIIYQDRSRDELLGDLQEASFMTPWGVPDDYLYYESERQWYPRTPEAADWDFEEGDFVNNTNWNNVSLSSLVPLGTRKVQFAIFLKDNLAGSAMDLRDCGLSGNFQFSRVSSVIANIEQPEQHEIFLDRNRCFQVRFSPQPSLWSYIRVVIIGWYV
jgi:hypothetical protein